MDGITCNICQRGHLQRARIRRLSGPAVAIGYIILIPSLIGVAFSILLFFTTAGVAAHNDTANVGAVASGIVIVVGVACFVSGLLGWLLVMKKNVLRCNLCQATVNAS